MEYGLPAADERVKKILSKARACAENDEWAQDDRERKARMDEFIALIDAYDGAPTPVPSETLADKIAED